MNDSENKSLWSALTAAEIGAGVTLSSDLKSINSLYETIFNFATRLPTLTKDKEKYTDSSRISALFIKRALNDLRSVWNLLTLGYTTQAATVASSMWENSIVIEVLNIDNKKLRELKSQKKDGIPWSCKKMSQIVAMHSSSDNQAAYESQWRFIYGQYQFLCGYKHPNFQTLTHDAGSTTHEDMEIGYYVVMALPDTRKTDLRSKQSVAVIPTIRLLNGLSLFSKNIHTSNKNISDKVSEEVAEIKETMSDFLKDIANGPLVVDTSRSKLAQDAMEWQQKLDKENKK